MPGGQSSTQFEVAVIRPGAASSSDGTSFNVYDGGRIRIINEPIKLLIRSAFRLQNAQIAGGPSWIETERYDIEAKTGHQEKPVPGQLQPLLQGLLADRFQLKFHREKRDLPVMALVTAKDGPKLKDKTEGEVTGMDTHGGAGRSQLVGTALSMDLLAGYAGNRLGRIVIDKTGLTGSYDFTLEWDPDQAPDSPVPSLVTAFWEQLGLRLEPQKSSVEVLAIDNPQKPSGN